MGLHCQLLASIVGLSGVLSMTEGKKGKKIPDLLALVKRRACTPTPQRRARTHVEVNRYAVLCFASVKSCNEGNKRSN